MFLSKIWLKFDYLTLLLTLGLVTMGILAISGATHENSGIHSLWQDQLQWSILGLICLIGVSLVDYRLIVRNASMIYILSLISLLLVFTSFFGHTSHGAHSWLRIKGIPIQIQPAEFAKLATIIMLARVLAYRRENWHGLWDIMRPLLIGAIPAGLILIQPDLGTAVVFAPLTLLMMYIAGLPLSWLLMLVAPASCLLAIGHEMIYISAWICLICSICLIAIYYEVPWTIWVPSLLISVALYFVVFLYGPELWEQIPKHQTNRIVGYLNPEYDPKGTNYNIIQAKIALGSGGFWGKGVGESTQGLYQWLPEFQHDFVFPILGEQMGFIGSVVTLALFLLLLLRAIETAVGTKTLSGSLIVAGVIGLFFSHILINVGMVSGLLPVTGLPLTFISYGGSFMLCSMIAVGLVINIRMRASVELIQEGFSSGRPTMTLPSKIKDDF